jgi:RimJ/RimL family protein N-acetyltransferase
LDASAYSTVDRLRDGRRLQVRALRPEDRDDLLAAVDRVSSDSLYRRFFTVRRRFTERETAYLVNVDFIRHVALVALVDEAERPLIVATGRYIVVEPGTAELAFAVVDDYQGQGIGSILLRRLAEIGRGAGLSRFTAEVLAENAPMLKVFEKSGMVAQIRRESEVVHVEMRLGA